MSDTFSISLDSEGNAILLNTDGIPVALAEEAQTSSNPLDSFFGAVEDAKQNSKIESELEVSEQEQESTGSLIEESEKQETIVGEQYNETTIENTENEIIFEETEGVADYSDVPRTINTTGIHIAVAAGIALVGAVVGSAFAIKAIVKSAKNKGIIYSTRRRRIESKLNSKSKNYKYIKQADEIKQKLLEATDQKTIANLKKSLDDVNKKIKQIDEKQIDTLLKQYGELTRLNKDRVVTVARKVLGNETLTKDNIKDYAKIIEKQGQINTKNLTPGTAGYKQNLKSAENLQSEINTLHDKVTFIDNQVGSNAIPLHYATKFNYKAKDNKHTHPIYVHRAISAMDKDFCQNFDKIHEQFPLAENEIKMCKITVYAEGKETEELIPKELKVVFDNKAGYNLSKALLYQKVIELKKDNSNVSHITVEEYSMQSKTTTSKKFATEDYDLTNQDDKAKFLERVDSARKITKTFNERFFNQKNDLLNDEILMQQGNLFNQIDPQL